MQAVVLKMIDKEKEKKNRVAITGTGGNAGSRVRHSAPQHPALLALCQAFLIAPFVHDPAERWARALFMSASTFRCLFLREIGRSFSVW